MTDCLSCYSSRSQKARQTVLPFIKVVYQKRKWECITRKRRKPCDWATSSFIFNVIYFSPSGHLKLTRNRKHWQRHQSENCWYLWFPEAINTKCVKIGVFTIYSIELPRPNTIFTETRHLAYILLFLLHF